MKPYNDKESGTSSVAASPQWKPTGKPRTKDGFSPTITFCFAVNYILGTGFLTIPWAFVQGGLLLSACVLVMVGILSDVAKGYVLETMAMAEAMLDSSMHWKKGEGDATKKKGGGVNGVGVAIGGETKPLLLYSPVILPRAQDDRVSGGGDSTINSVDMSTHSFDPEMKRYKSFGTPTPIPTTITPLNNSSNHTTPSSLPGTPTSFQRRVTRALITIPTKSSRPKPYLVLDRKFEVNALCRVFLTKHGLHAYTLFLSLYIYCTLWAYTCVFASAMAGAAPIFAEDGDIDDRNYTVYAVAYAAMVVPMSCLEMDEQVVVQVCLTGCRIVMLVFMVCTCQICAEDREGLGVATGDAPLVNFEGIYKMLPIVVFASIYHHSIPGLSNPVGDKCKLGGIFRATNVFSALSYAFIGVTLGWVFGTGINESSNLNWRGFHGGTGVVVDGGKRVGVALWARAVGMFVVCFPALDVVSAFPLNSITLGNNLMGAVYGRRIHEVEKNRWIVSSFRMIASIPPIILGILVRKLGTITDYAGTSGFIITFSFPALLYLFSRRKALQNGFKMGTGYATFGSSGPFAIFLCAFGIAMFLFVSILVFQK